jgi:hypothetical protein
MNPSNNALCSSDVAYLEHSPPAQQPLFDASFGKQFTTTTQSNQKNRIP